MLGLFERKAKKIDVRQEMTRRKSHYLRILDMFKTRREVTNLDLARITFRYSARLGELRKDGHKILAMYERPGVWRYIYKGRR